MRSDIGYLVAGTKYPANRNSLAFHLKEALSKVTDLKQIKLVPDLGHAHVVCLK